MEKKLSEELRDWREERPDYWKMDEFILKAEKIEAKLQNTSHNSDYAVPPTASPKLLNKMEKFAKECDDAGNNRDAKEVRSWVKKLRRVKSVVRHNRQEVNNEKTKKTVIVIL